MCHVSCVTCRMLHVMCQMSYFLLFVFLQSREAFPWRVIYQQGLPCLVFTIFATYKNMSDFHRTFQIKTAMSIQSEKHLCTKEV